MTVFYATRTSSQSASQSVVATLPNKVLVADNTVVTGSYNFSRHAQSNAENVLIIGSQALAQTYRQYIYQIMQKYSSTPP
jgi:phosphatidylserine/phosphatidylglycerophosphate/cardiolipin synthase-like enzyme